MASKMIFVVKGNSIIEEKIDFTYIKGLSFSQKQKNVVSLHSSIIDKFPNSKILEISTKSKIIYGRKISAFNLMLNYKNKNSTVENFYQSAKVFENSGPFSEVLNMEPLEAKKYVSLNSSGALIKFKLGNDSFDIDPPNAFYDYIFVMALTQNRELSKELLAYNTFTDIEFNEKRQVNCQARSASIFVFLEKNNLLEKYTEDYLKFKNVYKFFNRFI